MLRIVFSIILMVFAIQAPCITVNRRNLNGMLVARQTQPNPTSIPQTLDLVAWNKETNAKCEETLQKYMGKASNPAGISICYNIPYADKTTGVFAADLRLYEVAKPDAEWETVSDDIGIGIRYDAAAVTESNFNQNATIIESLPGTPNLVRVFSFLGLVKSNFLSPDMSNDDFKRLLIPIVTLKGTIKDKKPVETQLSTDEASLINGQFVSQTTNFSSPAPVPFKLPGEEIAIMPTGMILYSAWMVIGVSIVMYGTFERRRFRDHYRKRIAQSQPGFTRI